MHQRYPDCPEFNGLHVWPAERRSHGTGTATIRAAEALACDRGYHQIGLSVDDDNPPRRSRDSRAYYRSRLHGQPANYGDGSSRT